MPSFVTNNDYNRTEGPDSARAAIISPSTEASTQSKRRQMTEGCVPDLFEENDQGMNNSGCQIDLHGMYASHGVMSNKSQAFSFKDPQMYEIFEIQEQKIDEGFTMMRYFNKDQRRKILFTSNMEHKLYCYYIRNKIQGATPSNVKDTFNKS